VTESIAVTMPRLSDSMTEGTVARWLKQDGAVVKRGEAIVDIETDKATMAFEAEASGTLRLRSAVGETVAVGAPIALIESSSSSGEGVAGASSGESLPGSASATPVAAVQARPAVERPKPVRAARPAERLSPSGVNDGVSASPLARRVAAELGVDLAEVRGSGPYQRIFKSDVVGAGARDVAVPVGARRPTHPDRRPAAGPRLVTDWKGEAAPTPTIFVESEVAFTKAIELREQLRSELDPAPTLEDIVVKAVAVTLRQHPRLNSSWHEDAIVPRANIDVANASVVGDALIALTIADADSLPLPAVAARSAELLALAQAGSLSESNLPPATFTITNLGMFGTARFTPVLEAQQAASLGIGAVHAAQPRHKDGAPRVAAALCLVCDGRVANPAHAAMFLEALAELLEAPMRLLL
jgi:pyruvate dehydrogenase E2 component (dihydrolipoamide acetyltransferase)